MARPRNGFKNKFRVKKRFAKQLKRKVALETYTRIAQLRTNLSKFRANYLLYLHRLLVISGEYHGRLASRGSSNWFQ